MLRGKAHCRLERAEDLGDAEKGEKRPVSILPAGTAFSPLIAQNLVPVPPRASNSLLKGLIENGKGKGVGRTKSDGARQMEENRQVRLLADRAG